MQGNIGNFALTNPISLITSKETTDFTREDFLKVIKEKNLDRITFHFTAIDCKLKELKIPIISQMQIEQILAEGERCDGSSLFKGLVDTGTSDLYIVPDYKTAFLNPFEPGSLDFICRFLMPDGSLASFAPDNILFNAHQLLKNNTGYELHALGEVEFFLIGPQQNKIYPTQKQRGYHSSSPFIKTGELLNTMLRLVAQVTGNVKYAHFEVGYIENIQSDSTEINGKCAEQLEIEFLPTPVESTADNVVLAKWIIRNVAYQHGFVATFAPKLAHGVAGNGMHFHMALMKDGENKMTDSEGNLSNEAKMLIGGLCMYADSLTAFGNTVSASYLRLVPNQEAPTNICWSDMNRNALIRVPLGWTKVRNLAMRINPQQKDELKDLKHRQTVELRSPDGSAFAHLLDAGLVMAAEWGLTHPESIEISAKHYTKGNAPEEKEKLQYLQSLPASCAESSRLLLQQRDMYERNNIFPSIMITYFSQLLQSENDGNLNKRLLDMTVEERLSESRRIMHKDLHRH